jgi:hypothetical protein
VRRAHDRAGGGDRRAGGAAAAASGPSGPSGWVASMSCGAGGACSAVLEPSAKVAGGGGGRGPPAISLARPKSSSLTAPSRAITALAGLRSRCRTPFLWAAASPRASPSPIASARAHGIGRSTRDSGVPSISSDTMYGRPSYSPVR